MSIFQDKKVEKATCCLVCRFAQVVSTMTTYADAKNCSGACNLLVVADWMSEFTEKQIAKTRQMRKSGKPQKGSKRKREELTALKQCETIVRKVCYMFSLLSILCCCHVSAQTQYVVFICRRPKTLEDLTPSMSTVDKSARQEESRL